jgi:hypothetical protein
MENNVNTTENASNEAQSKPLKQGAVRCSVCGCFMRRLKLIEKIRLGLLPDNKHTHICRRSSISYETGVMEHE